MAKVIVAGEAVVVKSSMKLEDIKLIEKYRPKELTLMGGDDGKDPIFKIATSCGDGSINKNGAVFNGVTHDEDACACLTIAAKGVDGDIKDWIADQIGGALISLNKLEEKLPAVLAEIASEKANVLSNIEVRA